MSKSGEINVLTFLKNIVVTEFLKKIVKKDFGATGVSGCTPLASGNPLGKHKRVQRQEIWAIAFLGSINSERRNLSTSAR